MADESHGRNTVGAPDEDDLVVVYASNEGSQITWLVSMLQDEGIPAFDMTDNLTSLTHLRMPLNKPYRIMVPKGELGRSRQLIAEYQHATQGGANVDWDAVDVGDPEDAVAARIAGDAGFEVDEEDASLREREGRDAVAYRRLRAHTRNFFLLFIATVFVITVARAVIRLF